MNLLTALYHRINRPQRDLIVSAIMVAGVFLLAVKVELFEIFIAWTRSYESLQLDELPWAFLTATVMSVWFSHRRMRDLQNEVHRRTLAERTSMENHQMFISLFEDGLCGNFVADLQGNILLCNDAFRQMSGRRMENLDLARVMGPLWMGLKTQLMRAGKVDLGEIVLNRQDGASWVVVARFIFKRHDLHSKGGCIYGYLADVTEQHLAERELAALLKENQSLMRHAIQAQEDERRHIARELHDDMGQYLTAIRLDATALPKTENKVVNEHAKRITAHAEHIQQVVKRLLHRLRPVVLDTHGLIEAVHHLGREWRKQHPDISCIMDLAQDCKALPEPINIVAYRTVQEAMTNAARHAKARHIRVGIRIVDEHTLPSLKIEIRDDGIGFDPHNIHGGFGLAGMRERIEATGGSFGLMSRPGHGTTLTATIPLAYNTSGKIHVTQSTPG